MPASAQFVMTADEADTETRAQAALDSVYNTPRHYIGKMMVVQDVVTVTGVDIGPPEDFGAYIVRTVPKRALTEDPAALDAIIAASGDPSDLSVVDHISSRFDYDIVVFRECSCAAGGPPGFTQFEGGVGARSVQAVFQGSDLGGGPGSQAVVLNGTGQIPADAISVLLGLSWKWDFRGAVGAAGDQRVTTFTIQEQVGGTRLESYDIGMLYHTLGAVGPLSGIQTHTTLDVPLVGAGTIELSQITASHDLVDMVVDVVLLGAYTGA